MKSIHRVGVTIAGLATAATVAGAFVLQGYSSAQAAAQQANAQAAQATSSLAPEIVYVRPVPTPQTQTQPPVEPPPIIQIVPGTGDDDGNDRG